MQILSFNILEELLSALLIGSSYLWYSRFVLWEKEESNTWDKALKATFWFVEYI